MRILGFSVEKDLQMLSAIVMLTAFDGGKNQLHVHEHLVYSTSFCKRRHWSQSLELCYFTLCTTINKKKSLVS